MNYTISAPFYRDRSGTVHKLMPVSENVYADASVEVVLTIERTDAQTEQLHHTWRSLDGDLEIQPVIQVEDSFLFDEYLIPCVSIHGNRWGTGGEPKGLTRDGRPCVFDARRTSVPGCTLTESKEYFCALFEANDSEQSLTVSCSMEKLPDGRMAHRLLYPTIEEPLTYCCRDGYIGEYQTYVKLSADETFSATAIIVSGKPSREHFAMIEVQNAAQRFLDDIPDPELSREEMWSLTIRFAEKLLYSYKGQELFIIGHLLKPEGTELREDFEFGWCGQNGIYSRMMILDYRKNGNKEHLDKALACLDAWAKAIHPVTGLPWVRYEDMDRPNAISDTCNLSFYISEMLACYLTLQEIGIERPAYRAAALSAAD